MRFTRRLKATSIRSKKEKKLINNCWGIIKNINWKIVEWVTFETCNRRAYDIWWRCIYRTKESTTNRIIMMNLFEFMFHSKFFNFTTNKSPWGILSPLLHSELIVVLRIETVNTSLKNRTHNDRREEQWSFFFPFKRLWVWNEWINCNQNLMNICRNVK